MFINVKRERGFSLIEFIIGIVIASLFIMGSFQIIANVITTSKRFLLEKQVQPIVESIYHFIESDALNIADKCILREKTCQVFSEYPLIELLPVYQASSFSDMKVSISKEEIIYQNQAFDLWHVGIISSNRDVYSFRKIVDLNHVKS